MKPRRVTIKDVAEAAGCSPGTVSFVINRNRPISAPVRRRVLDAIEALQYRPYGKRGTPPRQRIALLADNMGANVVEAFVREISRHGFLAETYYIYGGYDEIQKALTLIGKAPEIGGIINTLPQVTSVDLLKWCRGIPAIIYIRNGSMLSSTTMDFKQGMTQALHYLAGLMHTGIAFLYYTSSKDPCMLDRIDSFKSYKLPGGYPVTRFPVPCDYRDPKPLFAELDALYRKGVTAFIASTMDYAVSVLQWSYQRRLLIPDELSLLVFEDSEIVTRQCVALTAVQLPLQELARHTFAELLAQINDQKTSEPCKLATILQLGESTGPAPKTPKTVKS